MPDGISGRDRLRRLFAQVESEQRAALLPYLTAGLPDVAASVDLFVAMAEAGADGFEIGIPYADPLMDGPVIQEAASRALQQGVSPDVALRVVSQVVNQTGVPVLAMTYANPVFRAGAEAFAARLVDAGAAGLIVADLPSDEAEPVREAVDAVGLGMVLFAAPTTDDVRLSEIVRADPVFVYGIADLGVTGERQGASARAGELAARVRAVGKVPLVLGVGISNPDQARRAAAVADGVIVGSALVRRVLESRSAADASRSLAAAVAEFAAAVRLQPASTGD